MRAMDKTQAALAASFPVVALGVLNHHYKAPLYAWHSAWFWLADAVNYALMPLLVWWLVMRPARISLADCGLSGADRTKPWLERWAPTLFFSMLLVAWSWPVFVLTQYAVWNYGDAFNYKAVVPLAGAGRWLVPLYLALSAALVEELFYRALPWLYIEQRVPAKHRRRVYVWTTSLVFALAHSEQGPGGMVATFWFGWLAARMYERHRNLWPLLLAHLFIALVVYGT